MNEVERTRARFQRLEETVRLRLRAAAERADGALLEAAQIDHQDPDYLERVGPLLDEQAEAEALVATLSNKTLPRLERLARGAIWNGDPMAVQFQTHMARR